MDEINVVMEETPTAEAGAAVGVWYPNAIPHLGGAPVSEAAARRLFEYLTGETYIDHSRRMERYPRERTGLEREMRKQDDRVRRVVSGFLLAVARMIGPLPPDVLSFKLADGRDVDVASILWNDMGQTMRGTFNALGWMTDIPPALRG